MLLLVSVRHVGAHPDQHSVSIQISINLGKTFLRISRIRNIPLTWILARVSVTVPPFISQILDFIYWRVLLFTLIYFEWRDTENQQYDIGRRCRLCESYQLCPIPERNTGSGAPNEPVLQKICSWGQFLLAGKIWKKIVYPWKECCWEIDN